MGVPEWGVVVKGVFAPEVRFDKTICDALG
jgi:hypothetical protein